MLLALERVESVVKTSFFSLLCALICVASLQKGPHVAI